MKNLFDLQLFNEEPVTEPEPTNKPDDKPVTDPEPAKELKYTDDDVDRIINDRLARWRKEQDAAKAAAEEAERLKKMNAEQKQKYEFEKLQKENEELKKAALKVELGKTASSLLRESDIEATDDILSFVVGVDAEATKENIDKFVKIIESQLKKAEIARATGETPKNYQNNGGSMSEIEKRIAKYM